MAAAPALSSNDSLVDQLVGAGLLGNKSLSDAFRAVDRGYFVLKEDVKKAYEDKPYRSELDSGGVLHLSAAHMYARSLEILEMLAPRSGLSFLNVGSGSGYLSALAAYIVGANGLVHGVEVQPDVTRYAEQKLRSFRNEAPIAHLLSTEVTFICGNALLIDGAGNRKYDRIYIGAQATGEDISVFQTLLNPGGILVGPFDDKLLRIRCSADGASYDSAELLGVRFAPLIRPGAGQPPLIVAALPTHACEFQPNGCFFRGSFDEVSAHELSCHEFDHILVAAPEVNMFHVPEVPAIAPHVGIPEARVPEAVPPDAEEAAIQQLRSQLQQRQRRSEARPHQLQQQQRAETEELSRQHQAAVEELLIRNEQEMHANTQRHQVLQGEQEQEWQQEQDALHREQVELEHRQRALNERKLREQQEREQAQMVVQFMRERCADESTARLQLEQSGWDLQRAMENYMPPLPDSPVAGRTLASSNFKAAYTAAEVPEGPMELGGILMNLIQVGGRTPFTLQYQPILSCNPRLRRQSGTISMSGNTDIVIVPCLTLNHGGNVTIQVYNADSNRF
jgi:protein-L-isoaspartate O-methyltransferase